MHYKLKTRYYFINKFDAKNIDKLDKETIVIYRNYSPLKNDLKIILSIKNYCHKRKLKFYLSNNIKLAIKLSLDGAYIPSFNKNFNHLGYSLKKKFKITGSAHNIAEIRMKELQKAEKIVLSSLFKKNQNYLGINKFKLFSNFTNKEIIALGGISKKNLKCLKLTKSLEFAGISYFE